MRLHQINPTLVQHPSKTMNRTKINGPSRPSANHVDLDVIAQPVDTFSDSVQTKDFDVHSHRR
jgi:hypothetical protein